MPVVALEHLVQLLGGPQTPPPQPPPQNAEIKFEKKDEYVKVRNEGQNALRGSYGVTTGCF